MLQNARSAESQHGILQNNQSGACLVLAGRVGLEVIKDEDEDKEVVDGQALLQKVPGKVFSCFVSAQGGINAQAEGHSKAKEEKHQLKALL